MAAQGSGILQADGNLPPDGPPVVVAGQGAGDPPVVRNQLQAAPPVAANVFTRTLLNTLGFSIRQVRVLVEDVYDSSDTMLY